MSGGAKQVCLSSQKMCPRNFVSAWYRFLVLFFFRMGQLPTLVVWIVISQQRANKAKYPPLCIGFSKKSALGGLSFGLPRLAAQL